MNFADLRIYTLALAVEEREALEDEGLCIHGGLSALGYDAAPPGYLAFASTGGNGVHFGIPSDNTGPVVMTVPMAFDNPNIVLGADLQEFLSLGCVYGYFGLEQFAYDLDHTVECIQAATEQSPCLYRLSSHFNLRPWQAVGHRLEVLKTAYPRKLSDD